MTDPEIVVGDTGIAPRPHPAADVAALHARPQEEQELEAVTKQRDTLRAMLTNVCERIKQEMGARYLAVVDEASGHISVNTAFSVALREEREAAQIEIADREAALHALRDRLQPYLRHKNECSIHAQYGAPYVCTCGLDQALTDQ